MKTTILTLALLGLLVGAGALATPAAASPGCSLPDGHSITGFPDCVVACLDELQIYSEGGNLVISGCRDPFEA